MFERELMMSGLKRQRELLDQLMGHLESNEMEDHVECEHYEATVKRVEKNLRRLRQLRKDYAASRKPFWFTSYFYQHN